MCHQQGVDVERKADRRDDANQPLDRGKGGLSSNGGDTHEMTVSKEAVGKSCTEATGPMLCGGNRGKSTANVMLAPEPRRAGFSARPGLSPIRPPV